MTLDTFFEKFDLFADAPDAVAKMRELILELAVQGRVADQDPDDESAAELLQQLIKFKLDNPLSGRSGRSKEGPPEVEVSSDGLPNKWVSTTIGEVLYVIRGASPRPKGDPEFFSETRTPYHWVKISDIRKHGQSGLLMDTDEFLTEAGMRKSVLLPKGTLVLTNSATIGVPIVLGIEGCCIHDGYLAFPNFPHALLSQKFLLYLFHTLKKHAERNARGLAQLNLNTDLVRSFPFGLPPLAEQKRIVAKVDELMALCDRLEAQQQERETQLAVLARASLARFADAPTPANLDLIFHKSYFISPADLRKSILTLAVQGRLVSQNPNEEPVESVLDRIAVLRGQFSTGKRAKAAKRVRDIDISKCSYDLPDSWTWCRLGDLVLDFRYGTSRKCDRKASGVPVLRIPNIHNGRIDFTDLKFTSMPAAEFKELSLQKGDLLLVRSNGSENLVGRSAVACAGDERFAYAGYLVRARLPENEVFASFLHVALSTPAVRDQIEGPIRTTSGVKNINTTELSNLVLPLPPLAEQRRIVAKVDQLMAMVDTLETQLAYSRAAAANLLSALVAELTIHKGGNDEN